MAIAEGRDVRITVDGKELPRTVAPIEVRCDYCGAESHRPCRAKSGKRANKKYHALRVRAALTVTCLVMT